MDAAQTEPGVLDRPDGLNSSALQGGLDARRALHGGTEAPSPPERAPCGPRARVTDPPAPPRRQLGTVAPTLAPSCG